MAGSGNRLCANCIGTLLFSMPLPSTHTHAQTDGPVENIMHRRPTVLLVMIETRTYRVK